MAAKYVVVERPNPRDPQAPRKFYAHAKSSGEVTMKEIAGIISKISTVSSIDTMAVLEGFNQVLPELVSKGNIVRLGDFGSFNSTIHSQGEVTADKVSASSIKNTNLRFRAGNDFKDAMKLMKYERANGNG